MKILYITAAALTLGACTPPPTCGLPNEPVVIGYAKDGNLIYDDQAALSVPCAVVTPSDAQTPTETPTTASTPPTRDKSNAGRGNGSEGNPDQDPGNSGGHNKGGD